MNWPLAVGLYIVIWWLVLFAVLPFGVTSQAETDNVVPGTDPGAPGMPRLWLKALVTTGISAIVFAAVYTYIVMFEF